MTPTQQQLESMWQAVAARDSGADGRFVYAVVTTGIYCRPACPSRRPHRDNVCFFATAADAGRAGFRACKRCRPNSGSDPRIDTVTVACRTIETSLEHPALAELAAAAGMSRYHFQRLFHEVTGVTPKAYAVAHRGARVRSALVAGTEVTEVIYCAGFNSASRFYASSVDLLGMTPSAFRRGGSGEAIRFAVGACSLGAILVAATGKGICAIALGDDPDTLVRELCDQFPNAELLGADASFEAYVAAVIGCVEAPGHGIDLPLDIRGTVFQQQVWQALRRIPPGTTVSYAEIAACIARPGSARAVARACASNRLAVVIPCHRVVRSDGRLSGYRWGVDRKRGLLAREYNALE